MSSSKLVFKGRSKRGSIAEFAPVLFIFFMMVLFPLINLIGYGTAVATVFFIGTNCAQAAETATSYPDALSSMHATALKLMNSGFGKFARLSPGGGGGYNNCGADLYVIDIDYSTNTRVVSAANMQPAFTYEPNHIYEFQVVCNYQINPFLNLAGVPGIGSVPIVGKPCNTSFSSCRNAEHPEGVMAAGGTGTVITGGGPMTPFP
ncbi:MAG: hypothetical protein IAF58_20545 [Leptolyngbya sp.]|nr:hypothetical protein [Candidatus Melainabacteria bacterium]